MLGGLYGDLPPPSSSTDATSTTTPTPNVWSSSTKFAPTNLRKPFPPPQTILRSTPKPKPTTRPIQSSNPNPTVTSFHPVTFTGSIIEEYDPTRPNDYEEYLRERKRKQADLELRRELEERDRREREESEKRDKDRERELNVSGEEAWRRRAGMGGNNVRERSASPPTPSRERDEGKMSAAQRMMAKMGWKKGQGLGKSEQGITTPLVAKKTDKRAGVIVNASESNSSKKVKSVNFNGLPTRVVLLRNMVGPGEVDDDLEGEVAEECTKFGKVTRVLIFEITEPNFPHEEAVRIFIQFEKSEQATKAIIELEGRFFGGRVVRAGFYDEERFAKNELAPLPGEIPGFF